MQEELLQLAFSQARTSAYRPLRQVIDAASDGSILSPLLSFDAQPELEQAFSAEQLFVSKKELESVVFGDIEPEVAAPLCFIIGAHQRTWIDASRLFSLLHPTPEILVQLAILPASWVNGSSSVLDSLLGGNIAGAVEALIDTNHPAADYLAALAVRTGQQALITNRLVDGLRLTEACKRALGVQEGACVECRPQALLSVLRDDWEGCANSMFLSLSSQGVISAGLASKMIANGLDLSSLPYSLHDVEAVDNYYRYALFNRASAGADHMAWIERTFVNALTCHFVAGDDEAVKVLGESMLVVAPEKLIVNDWVGHRPSLLGRLSASQLDAKIGLDLGL